MGCVSSYHAYIAKRDAKAKSDEIDKLIRKDEIDSYKRFAYLLLGRHRSGRSTFVRQLEFAYGLKSYSEEDRSSFKPYINTRIVNALYNILVQMKQLNIPFANDTSVTYEETLKTVRNETSCVSHLSEDVKEALEALWADGGVQECFNRRFEIQPNEDFWTIEYFMNGFDRIRQASYLPTFVDILHTEVGVVGLKETHIEYKNSTFKFIDPRLYPGPHRWLHHFQDVDVVLYFVDLSEYDKQYYDEEGASDLQNTLDEFEKFCQNSCFIRTDVILLFNKKDLFEEKLSKRPLTICFPEYEGGNNYDEASQYVQKQFESRYVNCDSRDFYFHFVCAMDSDNVNFIFSYITDVVLQYSFPKLRRILV